MSEENPYQAPQSNVEPEPSVEAMTLGNPQSVPVGRGMGWIGDGFQLFKMAPGIWIANVVIFFVILMVMSLIPVVSLVLNIIMPVFMAGFMLGCRDLEQGEELTVGHLFAGFKNRTGALIGVGALYMVLLIVVMVIMFAIMFGMGGGEAFMAEDPAAAQSAMMGPGFMIGMLVGLALMIPVAMAYWFAPALVALHEDVGVVEAMKLSFMGCIKNIIPFLLYGIVVIVLAFVASIPLMLGWLVLGPTMLGSMYAAYREIFTE
jgi:uncharacterized membrane protein